MKTAADVCVTYDLKKHDRPWSSFWKLNRWCAPVMLCLTYTVTSGSFAQQRSLVAWNNILLKLWLVNVISSLLSWTLNQFNLINTKVHFTSPKLGLHDVLICILPSHYLYLYYALYSEFLNAVRRSFWVGPNKCRFLGIDGTNFERPFCIYPNRNPDVIKLWTLSEIEELIS